MVILIMINAYLGFGYLYKFVMFFFQKAENNRLKNAS